MLFRVRCRNGVICRLFDNGSLTSIALIYVTLFYSCAKQLCYGLDGVPKHLHFMSQFIQHLLLIVLRCEIIDLHICACAIQ